MKKNLLLCKWSVSELEEVLSRHPRTSGLAPLGAEAWHRVANNSITATLSSRLQEAARREIAEPLPVLTDELYASFRRTGHRLQFEMPYFARRRLLGRAAISLLLCAPDDPWRDRLITSTVEKFTAIFEEESWALPAHVNWDNDDPSGKDPLQIDLFCAETANLMAEMLELFGTVLPQELQVRVRQRLHTTVFQNFVDRHDKFHWPKVSHNWNAVCHQGVIGAALSQVEDVNLLARMLLLARESLPLFLSGFTKDGGCTEGVGYWSYGFGWFSFLNAQLEARTNGELSLFEGDNHVREIARFGPRMSLAGGKRVNFADNGSEGLLNPAVLSFLGEWLHDSDLAQEAGKIYRETIATGIDIHSQRCDVFYLSYFFLRFPPALPPDKLAAPADCFLPDLAVLVAHATDRRGHSWDFAAKGGHNDEHHNHNDCGNYLLNIDGTRFVAEIGAPEYVKDFFSPKRYEFLAARSLGHSLPVINGHEQAAGASYASRIVSHLLAPDQVEFQVDLTACYPPEAGCGKCVRTFHFDKVAGRLTVTDEFELNRIDSVESALIAVHSLNLSKNQASIQAAGLNLLISPAPGTLLDRVEIHSYRDHAGQEAPLQRLVLRPEKLSLHLRIGVEMRLV